ncbi:MAG: hypothetical protein DMG22_22165 [Acidobacteria bacterium]|nr:MAG: hypothetical protein DMG22_22165 [Acidobacteriota bacterium]
MKKNHQGLRFVVCIQNPGYEGSLELRKIYRVLRDLRSQEHHLLRVVDESGEDYLYPENFFAPVRLSKPVERALLHAS